MRKENLTDRALPLWYKTDTGPGQFRVKAALSATGACGEVLLFVSRRLPAELVRAGLAEPQVVPKRPVHAPLNMLEAPPPEKWNGPADSKPLVDYGLIPNAPWPII